MQCEAAHADEDGRAQVADKFQLGHRRIGVTGADSYHADAEMLGASRPYLAGGLDAERKRKVAKVAGADADAREGAAPRQLGIADVILRARIEYRLSGGAARAPVFRDRVPRRDAQVG